MCSRGLLPVETIHLIRFRVIRRNDGLSWSVLVRRVENGGNLLLRSSGADKLTNEIQNRLLLNESGSGIDIQEDAIGAEPTLSQIARPHFQVVLRDVDTIGRAEVLWELPDLIKLRGSQNCLNSYVKEVENLMRKLCIHLPGLVQVKRGQVFDNNLHLLVFSSSGHREFFIFVKLHREDKVPAPDKVSNNGSDCRTRRPDSTAKVLFVKKTEIGRIDMNEPLIPNR